MYSHCTYTEMNIWILLYVLCSSWQQTLCAVPIIASASGSLMAWIGNSPQRCCILWWCFFYSDFWPAEPMKWEAARFPHCGFGVTRKSPGRWWTAWQEGTAQAVGSLNWLISPVRIKRLICNQYGCPVFSSTCGTAQLKHVGSEHSCRALPCPVSPVRAAVHLTLASFATQVTCANITVSCELHALPRGTRRGCTLAFVWGCHGLLGFVMEPAGFLEALWLQTGMRNVTVWCEWRFPPWV